MTGIFISVFGLYLRPQCTNPRLNLTLVVGCVLIFASVWVAWLNSWWMRGTSPGQGAALARLPLLSARLLSGLGLVFLIGVEIMFSNPDVVLGLPAWAGPLFALPWLILFLSLALTVQCGLVWMRGHLGWSTRLHLTLLALVGFAFSVWLVYWNLLKLP